MIEDTSLEVFKKDLKEDLKKYFKNMFEQMIEDTFDDMFDVLTCQSSLGKLLLVSLTQ